MNALVTGGAGFIGSHLVDALVSQGFVVSIIDDFSSGNQKNIIKHQNNKRVKIYRQSITDDLKQIFTQEKPEIVFHLAAIPDVQFSIQHPNKTHRVNVQGTKNLLTNSADFKIKKFVYSSSCAIYGHQDTLPLKEEMIPNPLSPYADQKLESEKLCQDYFKTHGLKTISLRYFNVFGPRQNPTGHYATLIPKFISLISENKTPTIYGDGEQTRDFTYVDDVVKANLTALTANEKCWGETFNIGSGNKFSVNEVTAIIAKLNNKNVKPQHSESLNEIHDSLAETSKSQTLLGWRAKTNFETGLKTTFEFLTKNN